jgi:Cu-Zn family superoxide dismutase
MTPFTRSIAGVSRAVPLFTLLLAGASGCGMQAHNTLHASATLYDALGRQVGAMQFTDAGTEVVVAGEFHALSAGEHGIHFHTAGKCDAANGFASAGGHFNPSARKHGLENPAGPHAGDLPNLTIAQDGTGSLHTSTSRVTLAQAAGSLLDVDGTAVIVHEGPDDQRTDPAGNSGTRIACGVIHRS